MSHQHHDIFESRKQFQLERIILFSDAVFAIAITLLVIEIKVPHFEKGVTQQELAHELRSMLSEFLGFILSFAVIGRFWISHHRLFGYVISYTPKLMWLNLLMLLWVVIMPFSTFLNMQYGNLDIVWFWYSVNLALIELSYYFIWRYIGNKESLCHVAGDKKFISYVYRRCAITFLIFLAGGFCTLLPWLWMKWTARFMFFLIFPALTILRKRYEKHNKKATV
jgi:uncharacterized membrane protein